MWKAKKKKLLREKIDITAFMIWLTERYPESLEEFQENPEIQYRREYFDEVVIHTGQRRRR